MIQNPKGKQLEYEIENRTWRAQFWHLHYRTIFTTFLLLQHSGCGCNSWDPSSRGVLMLFFLLPTADLKQSISLHMQHSAATNPHVRNKQHQVISCCWYAWTVYFTLFYESPTALTLMSQSLEALSSLRTSSDGLFSNMSPPDPPADPSPKDLASPFQLQ